MPTANPAQRTFAAGELSHRMRGQFGSEVYGAGLELCENFKVLPQGPVLMRPGSWDAAAWPEADQPRLFDFRVSGSAEDYVFAVGETKARLYSKTDGLVGFHPNLIKNGHFDSPFAVFWTLNGGLTGDGFLEEDGRDPAQFWATQAVPTIAGHTYALSFRSRYNGEAAGFQPRWDVLANGAAVGSAAMVSGADWRLHEFTFVGTGAPVSLRFEAFSSTPGIVLLLDDVVVYDQDGALVTELDTPWSAAQLAEVQYSAELANGRAYFVHRNVHPWVLHMVRPGVIDWHNWYSDPEQPWAADNWPGVVEAGFQGRLWLGSTPSDPHTLWGSKSGNPTTFSLGTGTPADGISVIISTKGRLEWIQGQRVLMIGSEAAEHIATGSGNLISQTDIDVQDASGFGSAPLQARHIGDQVLFVTSDRRKVRALDYSWEKQAWFSKAITWHAEDLIDSDIVELHFARSPDPTILVVLASGALRACTYDRGAGVAAWYRVELASGLVRSACVARTAVGDELWLSMERGGAAHIERLPLHESGVGYFDAAHSGAVSAHTPFPGDPAVARIFGLNHLEGLTVGLLIDGELRDDLVVAGGVLALPAEDIGRAYQVGLRYQATMRTMPLEGGAPAGTSQAARRRWANICLRLNASAIPLVNGERAPERLPGTPLDSPTDLLTGDVIVRRSDWEDDGRVTIKQDLPFRTEVLAIFGTVQVNQV